MTSLYRWQVAALMLTVGWALQSTASGEALCPHCAQKSSASHTQKHGARGYSHGISQKGHAQKGYGSKGHSHQPKEHWFFSHHPPAGPILESAAIRRVPLPQEVNYRIQRDSGELRPESARAPESAAAPDDDIKKRLAILEEHVSRLYTSLDKLVDQLQQK